MDDDNEALELLHSISYFRLARYWQVMEDVNSTPHKFLPNCHLDDVIRLYLLDKKLRALTFISIQDIEIALRTRMIQQFSLKYGAFWFMDASLFKDMDIFQKCLENIQKEVSRSKEDFLQEH